MRVACIGVGGQGWLNLRGIARCAEVVGLCDVDKTALLRAANSYPNARTCTDYRDLFAYHQEFNAVVISVPDHLHTEIVRAALTNGKHCFCEKPLAAHLKELDEISEIIRPVKAVTCLGCQGVYSARFDYLRKWLPQSGIGEVTELAVWTDRPGGHWVPSEERLSVSGEVEWPLWLGSTLDMKCIPKDVHPISWRHYLHYGTGPTGDMGSHLFSLPLLALNICGISQIEVVQCERPVCHCFPTSLHLQAALRTITKDITLNWYHGSLAPTDPIFEKVRRAENGILIKGCRGTVYCPEWNVSNAFLFQDGKISRIYNNLVLLQRPDIFQEWIACCESNTIMDTDFSQFGIPLTAIVLKLVEVQRV
jgi:predicted dehydrogenase